MEVGMRNVEITVWANSCLPYWTRRQLNNHKQYSSKKFYLVFFFVFSLYSRKANTSDQVFYLQGNINEKRPVWHEGERAGSA